MRDGETIYFAIAPPAAALGGGSGPVLRPYGLLAPPKRLMRSLKQVGKEKALCIAGLCMRLGTAPRPVWPSFNPPPPSLLTPNPNQKYTFNQVRRALEMGVNAPKLTMEGFGGTYFMYDPRKRPLGAFLAPAKGNE